MVSDMAAAGAYTVIFGSGPPLWMEATGGSSIARGTQRHVLYSQGATGHLRVQPSNILGFCCIEGSTMGLANTFPIHETGLDYDHFPSAGMVREVK